LLARQTASPTLLRAVYTARPGSFPETPCAYIAGRDEQISYSAQTVERLMAGLQVVVVDSLQDASEEGDRMDILVDLLFEDFLGAFASVSPGGGLLQLTSIADTDVTLTGATGEVTYRGAIFTFGLTFVRLGRA
jgi:hypothetical protein